MPSLPLNDVQGFVLRSYGMDSLRLFVLHTVEPKAACRALGDLPVANAAVWDRKPDACVNVALTFAGLQALGVAPENLATFPEEFRLGAAARSEIVGDTGESDPANWKAGLAGTQAHVIVTLFAQTPEIREAWSVKLRALWQGAFTETLVQDADVLPGNVAHFGYRDGFSQPTIEGGLPNPVPDTLPAAPAGEFVLGYESQFAQLTYPLPQPDAFGRNGSFMALRVLEQDCAAFDKLLSEAPTKFGIESELLAAKLVGRWRNGTPLEVSPDSAEPNPAIPLEGMNQHDYSTDLRGNRCPIGSHMRRNNPRSSPIAGGGGLKHRIVRRGLPYGPLYDPAQPNDGIERGLLGIFIVVSLKDQFEFLMKEWVNGSTFAPGLGGTKDPILGDNSGGTGKFTIPVAGGPPVVVSGFSRLVQTRGAAYAFLPSLTGIRYLAGLSI